MTDEIASRASGGTVMLHRNKTIKSTYNGCLLRGVGGHQEWVRLHMQPTQKHILVTNSGTCDEHGHVCEN